MPEWLAGFNIADAGSLVLLILIVFWGLRQLSKGAWRPEREVTTLIEIHEKRINEIQKAADDAVATGRESDPSWAGRLPAGSAPPIPGAAH